MSNCIECTDRTVCTKCRTGYILRKDAVGCVEKCSDENANYYADIVWEQCTDTCDDAINAQKTACVNTCELDEYLDGN